MIDDARIAEIALFRGLNARARQALASLSITRRFAAGQALWNVGAEPRGLFVVLEGEVRVARSQAGRQHVIHTEGPGGTLGEVPLFGGGRYPARAVAVERTLCLIVSKGAISAAVGADPGLAFALLARLSNRVRGLLERLDGLAAKSVRRRLAEYLVVRARISNAREFGLGASQTAVAEELGTVREVVVRELRLLREAGIIRSAGRSRFIVADARRLERLCGNVEAETPVLD